MASSFDIDLFTKRLEALIHADRDKEALELIEELEEKHRHEPQVLRLELLALISIGGDERSLTIVRNLASREDRTIEDLYWTAQRAAEFAHYEEAESFLDVAIDKAKETGDHYYLDCSLLLRAYVRIRLQKFSLAKDDLRRVDDESAEITWSKHLGIISKHDLMRRIT
jgi:hypothetical protein